MCLRFLYNTSQILNDLNNLNRLIDKKEQLNNIANKYLRSSDDKSNISSKASDNE